MKHRSYFFLWGMETLTSLTSSRMTSFAAALAMSISSESAPAPTTEVCCVPVAAVCVVGVGSMPCWPALPFSAPSFPSVRFRFALGSPGVFWVCSATKLAMELKRAIRSGVSVRGEGQSDEGTLSLSCPELELEQDGVGVSSAHLRLV